MISTVLSLIFFAMFMTGSPGPGNLLMMAGGSSLGFRKSIHFLLGLVTGKTFVNFAIAIGLGVFVVENKIIFESLKYISSAFIIYLSISSLRNKNYKTDLSKFTFKNGLLVHPLSPKTWSMIILAQSQISDINLSQIQRSLIIRVIFTIGQVIFHSSWGIAGSILGKAFDNNIWTNRSILIITILFVIWFLLN
ncbi:MAG: hypothetical protein CL762_03360 [Chloroflexi bacterium]|nr:hypothetical protein [Chloroflexota bacterium]